MNNTIQVYHRNAYGVCRTYVANADQALALHELTGTRTLEARHVKALAQLGFTLVTVPDPEARPLGFARVLPVRAPYGSAPIGSLSLPSPLNP